ncbi:MAG: hypothetical protein KJO07_06845, partial [Deltaproteobacteria bacterium]|nr:hypothetical protein [Deltaproteobacteria bacterium]
MKLPAHGKELPGKLAKRQPSTRQARDIAQASRHAAVAEALGRARLPRRRLGLVELDGTFRQARADGAVDEAERRLERRIRAHLDRGNLEVVLTDNRYTMISVRREREQGCLYRVRLHHMFADASPAVTQALAKYIAHNDSNASRCLGEFIDFHQHRVRTARSRSHQIKLTTAGAHHDLQDIFDDINRRYFDGTIEARITWGQRSYKKRRRNSIKMGSYSVEDKLIRIHRSLDRAFVPRFFVEWIVYHEMLHQVHDAPIINGRRRFHTKEFLADEAAFARYDEA